jgi:zinc/manganese transport system substrate-binding protein
MAEAAEALAERLAALDGAHAATFRENAQAFAARMAREVEGWQARTAGAPGAVLYHKDADYLMDRLGVPVHGYLEPLPGIPPTARHIRRLVDELREREGVIFHMNYESPRGANRLAQEFGWPVHAMRNNVPEHGTMDDYVALIEGWVERLEGH